MDTQHVFGALDIGGTKIAVGVVMWQGRVVCQRTMRTGDLRNSAEGLDKIEAHLRACLDESGESISGIGIGCTGPINPTIGVIGKVANLPGWEGCRMVDELSQRFSIPVAMENDADAAALGEATWGSGVGVDRFLYITMSTGIGAGFVLDGDVYRGVDGSHPEMGHHTLDPSGPKCYCGASGCWESLASGNAIRDWYLDQNGAHSKSDETFSAADVFELHRAGDALAIQAIDRLSYYTGLGLANVTTILVPRIISIGGGLALSSDIFLERAVTIFRAICGEVPADLTVIRKASLRNDVGLIGAAAVALRRMKYSEASGGASTKAS